MSTPAGTKRVAIVTGGSRGIGLACVRRLARDGFRVAVFDVNVAAFEAARPALDADGFEVAFDQVSITDRAALAAAVQGVVERWGRIDALVNDAGVNRPGGLNETSDADWAAVIGVNLTGTWVCSSEVAKVMREQRSGAIVSIGSIAASGHGSSSLSYTASKSGITGLSRAMAQELAPFGITVNVVAPGATRTEWIERHMAARLETMAREVPMGRLATPEDIAGAVAFFASEDARYVTGQVLSVSGGVWMPGG
jgi:NAD(P)-dependent dehydrogenase (short-subunit alcohol dehydrogenase family)